MLRLRQRLWAGLLALALAGPAFGGGLGALKKDTQERADKKAKKRAEQKEKPQAAPRYYSSNSAFGSGTYPSAASHSGGFLSDFWSWAVAGPFMYRYNDPAMGVNDGDRGSWADEDEGERAVHSPGEAAMPAIRTDANWQFIDGDNEAIDGRLELGYKFVAFHARVTRYEDTLADLTQNINQYYGVLRIGGHWPDLAPGAFEIGIGAGVAHHKGDLSDSTSAAFTVPVKYYPVEWLGFEFRPAWYHGDYSGEEYTIGDYDLSASLGWRYVQLRGGYRWLWFQGLGEYLDGPYAGIALSF